MRLEGKKNRQTLQAVFGLALVGVIALSSLAWACTVQQRIYAVGFQASPGGELGVRGDWLSSSEAVSIRWNSQSGPVLAEAPVAANGTFSVQVPIPDVSPGVYFLVATSGQFGIARTPVEVVGSSVATERPATPTADKVSSDLWGGFERSSSAGSLTAEQPAAPGTRQPLAGGGLALVAVGFVGLLTIGSIRLARRSAGKAR